MQQLISQSIQAFNTNITVFSAQHFLIHTPRIPSKNSPAFRNALVSRLSSIAKHLLNFILDQK